MAKYQHWYIRGWVYEDKLARNGSVQRELKYHGEYYRPFLSEQAFPRLKLLLTALLAAIYALYILYSLCGAAGGHVAYAGAGCVLAIIPLIFQGMGVCSLWTAPYQMPFRNYYASILRTKVASAVSGGLFFLSFCGEAVFMVLFWKENGFLHANEWLWLIGCALCAAMSFAIFFLLHRIHFDILPGKIDTTSCSHRFRK